MRKAVLVAILAPSLGRAHPLVQGMGTQSTFRFSRHEVEIEFNVGFSPMAGFLNMIKADGDRDDRVSAAESELFADALLAVVLPALRLRIDDDELVLASQSRRIVGLEGSVGQVAFDIYWTLRAELEELVTDQVRVLTYEDGTYRNELSSQINWFPLEEGRGIAFLVVEPEAELVVDALRTQERKVKVLLSTRAESLHAWGTEQRLLAAKRQVEGAAAASAFEGLPRDRLPAAELVLGPEAAEVRVLAEGAPPAADWQYEIVAGDQKIAWEYAGGKPHDPFLAIQVHTFRIDTSTLGPSPQLRITVARPAVKEYRLARDGHDPRIRWTILAPAVVPDRGFFTTRGDTIKVAWQRLHFLGSSAEPAPTQGPMEDRPKVPGGPASAELPQAREPLLEMLQDIKKGLEGGKLGFFGFAGMCLFALVYGAAHAFGPGHGKSLVAAYLAGRRGRVRDAAILGLIVTFTHLASVYLLAVGGLLLLKSQSETAYRDRVVVAMQLLSSVLLFSLGFTLFYRIARGKGHYYHHHPHGALNEHDERDHSHDHGHEARHHAARDLSSEAVSDPSARTEDRVSFAQLLLVGLTGGMVPCPAGLLVVFASWYMGLFWPALILLFSLSLGLGGSLIGLGISVVLARKALAAGRRSGARGRISAFIGAALPKLPALSGLVIAGLGILLFCLTLSRQGAQVAGLLRALADAISP